MAEDHSASFSWTSEENEVLDIFISQLLDRVEEEVRKVGSKPTSPRKSRLSKVKPGFRKADGIVPGTALKDMQVFRIEPAVVMLPPEQFGEISRLSQLLVKPEEDFLPATPDIGSVKSCAAIVVNQAIDRGVRTFAKTMVKMDSTSEEAMGSDLPSVDDKKLEEFISESLQRVTAADNSTKEASPAKKKGRFTMLKKLLCLVPCRKNADGRRTAQATSSKDDHRAKKPGSFGGRLFRRLFRCRHAE